MKFFWSRVGSFTFDFQDESVNEDNKVVIRYIRFLFFVGFLFSIGSLFWVVLNPRPEVVERANPKASKRSVTLPRGSIYDRAGRTVARSVYLAGLYCSPRDIAGGETPEIERYGEYKIEFAQRIASAFNLDYDYVLKRINMRNSDGKYLRESVIIKSITDLSPHEIEVLVKDLNKWYEERIKPQKSKDVDDVSRKDMKAFMRGLLSNLKNAYAKLLKKSTENASNREVLLGPPLFVRYKWVREYLHKEIAGNIIGFASLEAVGDSVRFVGKSGIEHDWDDYLCGDVSKDAKLEGVSVNVGSSTNYFEGKSSVGNLYLTIDMNIQACLERELDKRIDECNAEDGMGIILDPHTGAILAMASRPSYDPNLPETRVGSAIRNKVIVDRFEPGSIMKLVSASAGLELKKLTPETLIDCEGGAFNIGGKILKDEHKMGVVTFEECFQHSSNIGFVKIGMMLGLDSIREYLRKFGFGERASSDFKYEQVGSISTNNSMATLRSMSIGYAVAVNTLQIARAYAVVANGGYLVEPYIVEKVVDERGAVLYQHKVKREKILSDDTVEIMKSLCYRVVLKGTGKKACIPEYKAGGKTGTAYLAEGGNYSRDRIIASFCGFAPLSNPRVVAVIVIRYPQTTPRYGGYVSAPVFKNVVRYTLSYLNVPPDPVDRDDINKEKPLIVEKDDEDDIEGVNFAEFERIISPEDINRKREIAHYSESMMCRSSESRKNSVQKEEISGKSNDDEKSMDTFEPQIGKTVEELIHQSKITNAMPNLIGLTKLQALEILESLGIGYECNGYGRVASQYPFPGYPLKDVNICLLSLSGSLDDILMEN